MKINLEIRLPHEAASVPIVRQMLRGCLADLGATDETRLDIELAVTEACANVVEHAAVDDDYQVRASVDDDRCVIDIVNAGTSPLPLADSEPAPGAEHGRGLQIINAVVDNLRLNGHSHDATRLHFEKPIEWRPDAVTRRLDRAT
jgi:serine/threonine-protein kinase RsbW